MDQPQTRTSVLVPRMCWSAGLILVAAGVSFFIAHDERFPLAAMLAAIAGYVILYCIIVSTAWFEHFLQLPGTRRTIQITYGIRTAVGVAFPLGMVLDIPIGLASLAFVEKLGLNTKTFAGTFLTTMVDGVLQHIALFLFALVLVYPFARAAALKKLRKSYGFEVIPVAHRADISHTSQQ